MLPDRLVGARLVLRKARPDDLDAIYENVWSRAELARTMFWDVTTTRDEAVARLARTMAYQAQNDAYFVCLRRTDEPIGFAGVREYAPGAWEETGICIARAQQGQGYGKEVLALLTEAAFGAGGRRFVYGCFRSNARSAAVCRALGFRYAYNTVLRHRRDGRPVLVDFYTLHRKTT